MLTPIPLLQNARVASPCDASWEGMEAVDGERVKFCLHCAKNVYNLSAMTQAEAEGLLRKHEGKLCVRYYQRRDGTVLTRDCPVGAQAVRMALIRRSSVAAGLFAMLFGAMAAMTLGSNTPTGSNTIEPTTGKVAITPEVPVAGGIHIVQPEPPRPVMMGAVAPRPFMGHMKQPEGHTKIIRSLPDKPHNYDEVSAKDSTDEAILKLRREK